MNSKIRQEDVSDSLGKGKRFLVNLDVKGGERPGGMFSFTIYAEEEGQWFWGSGSGRPSGTPGG